MMTQSKHRIHWTVIAVLIGSLLLLPAIGLAQDGGEEEGQGLTICNPATERLAFVMGEDCTALLELRAEGFGLGEIMQAWYLTKDDTGLGTDWQALLRQKQAEQIGWGHFKMAARLVGEGENPQDLLALRQSGVGWGQIKKARAIADAGHASFASALEMMQGDVGWEQIRAELGLPPGPPPWAGGGKNKRGNERGNETRGVPGPPPWANNKKPPDDGTETNP